MPLPTFIIIGAAKSGTTSVFDCLGQHPDVYVPPCKEPQYFSRAKYPDLARTDEEYAALFDGQTSEKAIGEASTSYLCDQQAPDRIKTLIPDVRLIALLRNPVKRAYALWWHMVQLGFEDLSFEDALAAERDRMESDDFRRTAGNYHGFYYYTHTGLYSRQVQAYFDLFGRDQVRIFIFEEVVKDMAGLCRELFEFIGVDPEFTPDLEARNPSHTAKFKSLQRFLTTPPPVFRKAFEALPGRLQRGCYNALKKIYWSNMKRAARPPLDPALESDLRTRFTEDIEQLEAILGKKPGSLW